MKNSILIAFAALATALAGAQEAAKEAEETEKPAAIWSMPLKWPQHLQLRSEMADAIRRGDLDAMERVCRAAIELLPGDASWHYNLACTLAHRSLPAPALVELEKAINFGYRDADKIAECRDFTPLRDLPPFKTLVEKARALKDVPLADRPTPTPRVAETGTTAVLNETNVVWNSELGLLEMLLKLTPPKKELRELALTFAASRPTAKERALLCTWLTDGTAAGNGGDLYLNRDRYHSSITLADFPHLTHVQFSKSAAPYISGHEHPNTLFPGYAVFGNLSLGRTKGPYWRSMARASFTDPGIASQLDNLYRNNQFWVIPCVDDYGDAILGDVFPANAPFQLISRGRSWSDKPFLHLALAASAAFQRPTKQAIMRRRLMGPTLQWLLRRSRVSVSTEEAYISAGPHSTVFDIRHIDPIALVKRAHELRVEQVPPAVDLSLVNSRLFPVRYPAPLRDYPDLVSELLFATRSAIAIVLRSPEGERSFLVRAETAPERDRSAEFAWRVVNGDASLVKIGRPLGDSLESPETGLAQITIDRRKMTERIDVACFAKSHATEFGAPSIISFFPIPQEVRTYRADGKIESIDYTNRKNYTDPIIALPRNWKDVYQYSPTGTLLGWQRLVDGKPVAEFTPAGKRIVKRNADGTPSATVPVRYLTRRTGNEYRPVELTYVDDGE